jgi:lipopolysaccharide/colanic/teichoic acid biosynthesis glycosyltransferase
MAVLDIVKYGEAMRSGLDHPGWNYALKRCVDLFLSVVMIVAFAPLMVLLALAVKVIGGSGPVFHRGRRVGQLGKEFEILKFRSMRVLEETVAQITAEGDPRITALGSLLRSTKLDELPQLWNVLKGDMSFVGPRPEAPVYVAHYSAEHLSLLLFRPGLTGLATLEYRNEECVLAQVEPAERENFYLSTLLPKQLDLELEYIRHWTLWADFAILARTVAAVITGLGAGKSKERARTNSSRKDLVWLMLRLATFDVAMWSIGLAMAAILRHGRIFGTGGEDLVIGSIVVAELQVFIGFAAGIYRGRFGPGRFEEVGTVVIVQAIVPAIYALIVATTGWAPVGRGTVIVAAYWALLPMLGVRYVLRYWQTRRVPPPAPYSERVLVYGTGMAVERLVHELLLGANSAYRPVGIIDDDPVRRNRATLGVPVVGDYRVLAAAAARYRAQTVVVAMADLTTEQTRCAIGYIHEAALGALVHDVGGVVAPSESQIALQLHKTQFEGASVENRIPEKYQQTAV